MSHSKSSDLSVNNLVATYLKENTVKNKEKVIDGVLKVLEKKK